MMYVASQAAWMDVTSTPPGEKMNGTIFVVGMSDRDRDKETGKFERKRANKQELGERER